MKPTPLQIAEMALELAVKRMYKTFKSHDGIPCKNICDRFPNCPGNNGTCVFHITAHFLARAKASIKGEK